MEFPPPAGFLRTADRTGLLAVAFKPLSAGIAGIFTGLKGPR